MKVIPKKFLDVLRCVHCKGDVTFSDTAGLRCERCSHEYDINNGIADLRGTTSIELPKIYSDRDYVAWLSVQAESREYFYRSSKLVSFVQNAGHRAVKSLSLEKDYKISLDLGCGDGQHYGYLKNKEACFGLDLDQRSLEILSSRYPDYFALKGNAYALPIKDRAVDCIISIYNLEHLVYLDIALEEMTRILSDGGDVFVSVPTEGSYLWTLARSMTTARKFTTSSLDYQRAQEIDHINCIWQLDKALKRHFMVKKRLYFPFRVPCFGLNLVVTYQCAMRETG